MRPTPYCVWWAAARAAVVTMPAEIGLANRDQAHAAPTRALEPVSLAPPPGPSPTAA